MGKNGLGKRAYLPRSIFNGQFGLVCKVVALVFIYWHPPWPYDDALAATKWQSETTPATVDAADQEELTVPGLLSDPTHSPKTPSTAIPLLLDLPFEGTLSMGFSFFEFLASPSQEKWGHSPSGRREPRLIPQKWRLGVNTALHGTMTTHPT